MDTRRRHLLITFAALPLVGGSLSACTSTSPKSAPGPRTDIDADVKLRWRAIVSERSLLALHTATAHEHPGLADVLAPLTAHHEEHLATLETEGPLPFRVSELDLTAQSDRPAPDVAADPATAVATLLEQENAAGQARFDDCLAATGTRLAAALASVAACEFGHGVVLEAQ